MYALFLIVAFFAAFSLGVVTGFRKDYFERLELRNRGHYLEYKLTGEGIPFEK